MLKKTIGAFALASIALIAGPPAVATAATLSSATSNVSERHTIDSDGGDYLAPAVWAWGATGLVGIGAMAMFGATVARSSRKTEQAITPDNVTSIYA